jgi:hypothetical protein
LFISYYLIAYFKGTDLYCADNGGLLHQAFMSQIFSLFSVPLLNLLLPSFFYLSNLYHQQVLLSSPYSSSLTQLQAHQFFQGALYSPAFMYSQVMRIVLMSVFYAYVVPFGLLFAFGCVVGVSLG